MTFTNVTGRSAYGWSAAAGNLNSMTSNTASIRPAISGDRVFLSSDHTETIAATVTYITNNGSDSFGVTQYISVNRAGAVPPVAADALPGATIGTTSGQVLALDPWGNAYWEGITVSSGAELRFSSSGKKNHYFRNCTLILLRTANADQINTLNVAGVVLDNTKIQFNNTGQGIALQNGACDLIWINTPAALGGTAVPTALLRTNSGGTLTIQAILRGVDLSALTTTLMSLNLTPGKVLLDSCRIASGLARSLAPTNTQTATDGIELVNCFDGTSIISERHTAAGDITTNRSTTLVGGAQDDVGLFSHQLVSSARSDAFAMPLDSFWMDVESTSIGAPRTATVEIISSASLNNTDISLLMEYQGTSGSSLGAFASTLPSALTTQAALPTSTATWNNAPSSTTLNPADLVNVTLSGGNLVATGTGAGGVRSIAAGVGRVYYEATFNVAVNSDTGCGIATGTASLAGIGSAATGGAIQFKGFTVWFNGSSTSINIGTVNVGNTVCMAIDFAAQMMWFRLGPTGSWNATSGTANDPVAGTGGLNFSALGGGPIYACVCPWFTSDQLTVNFGATTFLGTPPTGYGRLGATVRQRLQTTFTPQQAGRVRGVVRLGKASTTCWIDPRIVVT